MRADAPGAGPAALLIAGAAPAVAANAMIIYGVVLAGGAPGGVAGLGFATLCLAQIAGSLAAGVACDRGGPRLRWALLLAFLALAAVKIAWQFAHTIHHTTATLGIRLFGSHGHAR